MIFKSYSFHLGSKGIVLCGLDFQFWWLWVLCILMNRSKCNTQHSQYALSIHQCWCIDVIIVGTPVAKCGSLQLTEIQRRIFTDAQNKALSMKIRLFNQSYVLANMATSDSQKNWKFQA